MRYFIVIAAMVVGMTVPAAADLELFASDRLVEAVEYNDFELAQSLLVRGHNPDSVDSFGRSALIIAANAGNEDLVELMLKHRASRDKKDTVGNAALAYAIPLSRQTASTSRACPRVRCATSACFGHR